MRITRAQEFQDIVNSRLRSDALQSNPFISLQNVTKDFDLGDYLIRASDGISIDIAQYEYVAIIGSSGAGKSTLLNILGGLEKITEGKVILSFIDISPMEEETLATFRIFNVGFIFQNYNLISSLTALENIMFPLQLCGAGFEVSEQRAKLLLKQIGLEERASHLPFQLSAGEQQRVAIARALANDPPIIIADEPTANLDKKNAEFIGKMFEELRQIGKTVIVATHDDNLIKHAHRIVEMDDGKIIKDTKIHEITFTPEGIPKDSFYFNTYFQDLSKDIDIAQDQDEPEENDDEEQEKANS
jgi:putative ABC transport system ATP-binding protein